MLPGAHAVATTGETVADSLSDGVSSAESGLVVEESGPVGSVGSSVDESADGGRHQVRQPSEPRRGMAGRAVLVVGTVLRRPWIAGTLTGLALSVPLLFLFNVWPGTLPSSSAFISSVGQAVCFAQQPSPLTVSCPALAYPTVFTGAVGYPQNWAIAILQHTLGMSALTAFRLTFAAVLLAALIGARTLFVRMVGRQWAAWVGACVYLISPIVLGGAGYGSLQLGFMLLPCYVLADHMFLAGLRRRRWPGTAAAAITVVAVRVFAILTDPYSFVMSLVLIGVMYLVWLVRRIRERAAAAQIGLAVGTAAVSVVTAYLCYTRLLGTSSFTRMPIDFFRGQGVDLYVQVVPPANLWFADLLGLHHHLTAYQAYSDGPNITQVFVGWVLLTAAVAGAVLLVREGRWRRPLAVGLLAAGAFGFVLALGPSLRVGDFRAGRGAGGIPSFNDYLMPARDATAPTGLVWIYGHVPGIDMMRALYRWELLPRLALIALAVVAIAALARRGRTVLAVVVAVLLVVEAMPNPVAAHRAGVRNLATVASFDVDVTSPLSTALRPGERVLLVNPVPGQTGPNAFLANWLCPQLRVRCYNVGGDKAGDLARPRQPPAALDAIGRPKDLLADIDALFAAGQVDAVVLIYFDLRAGAYSWPPGAKSRQAAALAAQQLVDAGDYRVSTGRFFTVLRAP